MEALLGIGGVIVGGALVIIADILRYRRDRQERNLERLRSAVAEVLATYLDARAKVIAEKRAGIPRDRVSLFPADRGIALARLFTLPGSEVLRDELLQLGRVTIQIIDATDDDVREQAYNEQMEIIRRVEAIVRALA